MESQKVAAVPSTSWFSRLCTCNTSVSEYLDDLDVITALPAKPASSNSKAQYDLRDPYALANFLRDADIRLIRAPFMAELVRTEKPLPRRQEAPERALVSHDEVQDWASGTRNATICSISHAWETMEHPDPCRYQLRHAVNRLSMWKAARDCDFWVFYDYVSLFQFERFSEAEIRSFGAAMNNMHVLYAHECTVTLRIQSLTPDFLWQAVKNQADLIPVYDAGTKSVVPKSLGDLKANQTLYVERGWCKAEVEWSSLRTVNLQHQRICPSDGEEVSGEGTSCRVPMTPQKFESTMKHSKFTHKSDSTTVTYLQAKVFKEKVSACESLVLEGIPPAQMAALAEVLPFYKCLKRLKLSKFECGEEEAMAFGEALATSKVESLELQQPCQRSGSSMGKAIVKALERSSLTFINPEYQNFFEKEDAKVVMEVLRSKTYSRARLPFDAPVRLQALSSALEMNNISSMTDINLEGEQIGDPGAEALAEMLKVNSSVKSLSLALTGISEEGAQVLIEALEANRTLKTLFVDHEVTEVLRPVERLKRGRGDNFEVIDYQEQQAVQKYPDKAGKPGIVEAARAGDLAAIRGFARRGARAVQRATEGGDTALHKAAWRGHSEVVRVLLEAKASVQAKDNIGNMPLHEAASRGHLEVVQMLVAAKAPRDAKGYEGKTPLQCAQRKRHQEIVEFLRS